MMLGRRAAARSFVATTVISALLGLNAGCGNGLSKVDGQVTFDGQPIAGGPDCRATIYFYPEGGTGAPAVGLLDADGRYSVSTGAQRGVKPGPYKVTVSATKIIPPQQAGEAPSGRPITPRKYADPAQSGFRVDVAPGSNTFDFALESAGNTVSRR